MYVLSNLLGKISQFSSVADNQFLRAACPRPIVLVARHAALFEVPCSSSCGLRLRESNGRGLLLAGSWRIGNAAKLATTGAGRKINAKATVMTGPVLQATEGQSVRRLQAHCISRQLSTRPIQLRMHCGSQCPANGDCALSRPQRLERHYQLGCLH